MRDDYNEFSILLRYLEAGRISISEKRKTTGLGELNIGNLILDCGKRKKPVMKGEIVSFSSKISPLTFKLESILDKKNYPLGFFSFSVQVYYNERVGLNYGGKMTVNSSLQDVPQEILNSFFENFKINSAEIYTNLCELVEQKKSDSDLLDKLRKVQQTPFPRGPKFFGIHRRE